jgi:hypothetical protein
VKAECRSAKPSGGALTESLQRSSTRGVNRIITDSMHDIPHQNPQAVIDAIFEVVAEARARHAIVERPLSTQSRH